MTDHLIGRLISGKYAVKERLGSGGMGAVYRARHEATGGNVAIKFLHGTAALDDHAVKRFQLEAQNAAQLRSTHTIRVIDFGVDEGVFYLVMEHLDGRPLNTVLSEEGPLPWPRVVHIARQLLKSLWEAHEHGRQIVHRDIKPANIMLIDLPGEPDHVKVLDFGIARSLIGTGAGTQGLIGTPYYMAPELWRGEAVDPRTDLYALGCVVFEMLVGAPPFEPPPSATDVLLPLLGMHCNEPPPRAAEVVPGLPAPISAWVDRLLEKDRARRPLAGRQALEELDRAVASASAPAAAQAAPLAAPPAAAPPLSPALAATRTAAPRAFGATPVVTPPPTRERPSAPAAVVDETVDAPPRTAPAPRPPAVDATMTASRPGAPPPRAPRGQRPVWLLPLVAVAVAGLGAVAVSVALSGPGDPPRHDPGGGAVAAVEPASGDGGGEARQVETRPAAPHLRATGTFDPDQPLGAHQFGYRARLGPQDHVNPGGVRLVDAADVLCQDRVNYHSGAARDPEDQGDPYLSDPAFVAQAHDAFERVLDPTISHDLVTKTPVVAVDFYENGVTVEIVSY